MTTGGNTGDFMLPYALKFPETTALSVEVLEMEQIVAPYRDKYSMVPLAGSRAHVTLMFPFIAPRELVADQITVMKELFDGIAPFEFQITGTVVYPGALALTVNPESVFQDITRSIFELFPDYPPYAMEEGKIPQPHLTIVEYPSEERLIEIEKEFTQEHSSNWPMTCKVDRVFLKIKQQSTWTTGQVFILGG